MEKVNEILKLDEKEKVEAIFREVGTCDEIFIQFLIEKSVSLQILDENGNSLLHRIADNREIGMINLSFLILGILFFAYLTYVFAEADGFKYNSSLSLYLMICVVFLSMIILHLRDVGHLKKKSK